MACCFPDNGDVVQATSNSDPNTPTPRCIFNDTTVEDLSASEVVHGDMQLAIERLVTTQLRTVLSAHEQELAALKADHASLQERLQACEKSVSDVVDGQRQLENLFNDGEQQRGFSQEFPQSPKSKITSKSQVDMTVRESYVEIDCEAETVLRHCDEYEFKASTWDMMFFFGQGVLNPADSVFMGVCVAITLAVQFVFCLIVARSMNNYPLSDDNIAEVELWRYFVGHHIQYYQQETNSSLVARTCAGSLGLHLSGMQTDLYESISGFLGQDAGSTTPGIVQAVNDLHFIKELDGQVLSAMCFFLWTLSCLKEFTQVLHYIGGILLLRGRVTELRRLNRDLVLNQVSRRRCAIVFLFNTVPRLFLLSSLYWYGSHFLIYTIQLGELILNALALAFIMDIDDVIFDVFATASAKVMHQQLRPMPLRVITRSAWMHRYVDVRSVIMMIAVTVGFVWMWTSELNLLEEKMDKVYHRLCGNHQDFVFVENPSTNVLHFYNTVPYDDNPPSGAVAKLSGPNKYIYEGLKRLTDYDDTGLWQERLMYSVPEPTLEVLLEYKDLGSQAATDFTSCINHLDVQTNTTRIAWATALNFQVRGVWDVANQTDIYCINWASACTIKTAVRAMCPETCGCANIYAGIYDLRGCTSSCESVRQSKINDVVRSQWVPTLALCPDLNVIQNQTYKDFYRHYEAYHSNTGTLAAVLQVLALGNKSLPDEAWSRGCNLTKEIVNAQIIPNPCETTAYFASAVAFCPTSCQYTCIDNTAAAVAAALPQKQNSSSRPR